MHTRSRSERIRVEVGIIKKYDWILKKNMCKNVVNTVMVAHRPKREKEKMLYLHIVWDKVRKISIQNLLYKILTYKP